MCPTFKYLNQLVLCYLTLRDVSLNIYSWLYEYFKLVDLPLKPLEEL